MKGESPEVKGTWNDEGKVKGKGKSESEGHSENFIPIKKILKVMKTLLRIIF